MSGKVMKAADQCTSQCRRQTLTDAYKLNHNVYCNILYQNTTAQLLPCNTVWFALRGYLMIITEFTWTCSSGCFLMLDPNTIYVFLSRLSSSRGETSRAARMSASVTALRSPLTWAAAAPAGWRAGPSWSTTSPTSRASSTSWPRESTPSIRTPSASMTASSPAALSLW